MNLLQNDKQRRETETDTAVESNKIGTFDGSLSFSGSSPFFSA